MSQGAAVVVLAVLDKLTKRKELNMNIKNAKNKIKKIESEIFSQKRVMETLAEEAISMLKSGNVEAAKTSVDNAFEISIEIRMNENKLSICKELLHS